MRSILKEALEKFDMALEMNENERRHQLKKYPEFLWVDKSYIVFSYLLKAEILAFGGCPHKAKENLFKYTEVYEHNISQVIHKERLHRICMKLVSAFSVGDSDSTWCDEVYSQLPLNTEKEVDELLSTLRNFQSLADMTGTELCKSHYFNYGCALFDKSKYINE